MKDYNKNNITLKHGDSTKRLKELEDASIDSIVTDPPYFVGFMGKNWDKVNSRQDAIDKFLPIFKECLRVLKPGGHLLAFSLPRTSHITGCLLEDAGFELRDSIHWLFGSGFPKSHNIGLAIDKLNKVESKVVGASPNARPNSKQEDNLYEAGTVGKDFTIKEAQNEWKGFGTSLKPAHELIWLARKPLEEDTVAEQVLKTGTGGLNIDACRVGTETVSIHANGKGNTGDKGIYNNYGQLKREDGKLYKWCSAKGIKQAETRSDTAAGSYGVGKWIEIDENNLPTGRFPANLILGCSCENPPENKIEDAKIYNFRKGGASEHTVGLAGKKNAPSIYKDTIKGNHEPDCVCAELDAQAPKTGAFAKVKSGHSGKSKGIYNDYATRGDDGATFYEDGLAGASRFFYCAKVSTAERNAGLESEEAVTIKGRDEGQDKRNVPHKKRPAKQQNTHPTVKPLKLMSYLITLITPPNGTVLDPFAGSGSTGVAAKQLGFKFIGIEREKEYFKIAKKRLEGAKK